MCFGQPSAPTPIPAAPAEVLHNPFLDGQSDGRLIKALRTGRSALRIRLPGLDTIGFGGQRTQARLPSAVGNPSGNAGGTGRITGGTGSGFRTIPTAAQQEELDHLNSPRPERQPHPSGRDIDIDDHDDDVPHTF